jgi:polyisoprenoid-binding protein YceI
MPASTWTIDKAHSAIGFRIRHMVIARVNGTFDDWNGDFRFDPDDLSTSTVAINVNTASISTHEANRDTHLRSGDFFDVENYPKMTFKSTSVEQIDGERLRLHGQLTIRNVTRDVTLDAEFGGRLTDPWGMDRVGFTATTTIDRKEFGLTWNSALETGGVLVGDKAEVTIELEATAAGSSAA